MSVADRTSPPRRCGFTLIELLVVIGIISILMAILIPTIKGARAQSDAAACASNLRQLYNFQMFYADEHGGRLASAQAIGTDARWTVKLARYAGKRDDEQAILKLACNSVPGEQLEGGRVSYGINTCLLMPNWQQRRAAKFNQSEIILMGDKPVSTLDHLVSEDRQFMGWTDIGPTWFDALNHSSVNAYRHAKGTQSNMLMADGHVRLMAARDLVRDGGHWYWGEDKLEEGSYTGPCCE